MSDLGSVRCPGCDRVVSIWDLEAGGCSKCLAPTTSEGESELTTRDKIGGLVLLLIVSILVGVLVYSAIALIRELP